MAAFASVTKGEAGVQRLFDLYRKHGAADYIGEPISQTAHACQAGMLAELEGADPAGVVHERQHWKNAEASASSLPLHPTLRFTSYVPEVWPACACPPSKLQRRTLVESMLPE